MGSESPVGVREVLCNETEVVFPQLCECPKRHFENMSRKSSLVILLAGPSPPGAGQGRVCLSVSVTWGETEQLPAALGESQ